MEGVGREEYLESLLEVLTPHDVRLLMHAEDELAQTKVTQTIFPLGKFLANLFAARLVYTA